MQMTRKLPPAQVALLVTAVMIGDLVPPALVNGWNKIDYAWQGLKQ